MLFVIEKKKVFLYGYWLSREGVYVISYNTLIIDVIYASSNIGVQEMLTYILHQGWCFSLIIIGCYVSFTTHYLLRLVVICHSCSHICECWMKYMWRLFLHISRLGVTHVIVPTYAKLAPTYVKVECHIYYDCFHICKH